MSLSKYILSCACAVLVIVTVGCGSSNVQVSGTITLDDGTPVPGATVIFSSGITQGRGTTDAEGVYTLSFQKKNDGIPAGSYQVMVAGAFFKPDGLKITDDMDTGTRPMIDVKYSETETSPLTCEVPGNKEFDFVVEPSDLYKKAKK